MGLSTVPAGRATATRWATPIPVRLVAVISAGSRTTIGAAGRRMAVAALAVALTGASTAACGGGSSSPSSARTTTGSPRSSTATTAAVTSSTAPLGSGPATAKLALTGDAPLTGALTATTITCSFPGVAGPIITVAANSADPGIGAFMFVARDGVHLRISSGSGATYRQRVFDGAGVRAFDAARGARLDVALHETGTASGPSAALPAPTRLEGDVNCGGQRPGSSTIVLRGQTSRGAIDGRLDAAHVSCTSTPSGKFVTAVGIVKVGGTPTVVFVDGQPKALQIFVEPANSAPLVYNGPASAVQTTAHGMHVDGDATSVASAKNPSATLHLSGDAECGATG